MACQLNGDLVRYATFCAKLKLQESWHWICSRLAVPLFRSVQDRWRRSVCNCMARCFNTSRACGQLQCRRYLVRRRQVPWDPRSHRSLLSHASHTRPAVWAPMSHLPYQWKQADCGSMCRSYLRRDRTMQCFVVHLLERTGKLQCQSKWMREGMFLRKTRRCRWQ